MLGLCLMALLAMSVLGGAASSAQAKKAKCEGYTRECYPIEREEGKKEEEKGKFSAHTINQYKDCPAEAEWCFWGRTFPGKAGGFFLLGKVKVKLTKPITLQGGFRESEESINPENEQYYIKLLPLENGAETLESPVEPVEGGVGLIAAEAKKWPQALRESYKEAKENHETALGVKIEVAGGNSLFENPYAISTEAVLTQVGTVLDLPLKVRLINPWLERLDGGKPCTVGNEEYPITQLLTSGQEGSAGLLQPGLGFSNLVFSGARLVNTGWPLPLGAEPKGCGGEYESEIDQAIESTLGREGITVIDGQIGVAEHALLTELDEEGLGEI